MNTVYTCFPGGRFKCLTMSYDDGQCHDRRLVEIFNRHGIRGTFHLNSGLAMTDERRIRPEEFPALYKGHEVSCHTLTHPTIARCPIPSVVSQVLEDRIALERVMGYPIRGLSYPNGSHSPEICDMLKYTGVRYARLACHDENFDLPQDFMRWIPTCHHNHKFLELGREFLEKEKSQYQYLMYVWGHSFEFDRDDNWQLIEEFSSMMGGRDEIWYATNIEIVDYMDVFSRLQFAADNSFVFNPSAASAWIRVNDGAPIEIPGGKLVRL